MKKLFHRFICLLLTVCIIPVYQSAVAADNQQYLQNAILVENGIPRPITKAEYELLLEGIEVDIPTSPIESRGISFEKFVPEVTTRYLNGSLKTAVTPLINGENGGSKIYYGESITFTASFSLSLSSDIKKMVAVTVGGAPSAASNSSFQAVFEVPPHELGRVVFTPFYYKSSGTLQHWYQGEHELDPSLSDEEFLTADLPIQVGKFADGLYELETI